MLAMAECDDDDGHSKTAWLAVTSLLNKTEIGWLAGDEDESYPSRVPGLDHEIYQPQFNLPPPHKICPAAAPHNCKVPVIVVTA